MRESTYKIMNIHFPPNQFVKSIQFNQSPNSCRNKTRQIDSKIPRKRVNIYEQPKKKKSDEDKENPALSVTRLTFSQYSHKHESNTKIVEQIDRKE